MKARLRRLSHALAGVSLAFGALAASGNGVIDAAVRVGITAEALVVAGLSTSEGATALARCADATAERAALGLCNDSCLAASALLAEARADAILNPQSAAHQQAFADASTAFLTARAELELAESALFEAMVVDLDFAAAERLRSISRRLRWKTPACFLIFDGDDSWRRRLEAALRSEARAIRTEDELDPDVAALLLALRSDPAVQLAQQRLDAGLSAMRALFEQP